MYDLIGDIHGHAAELERLLIRLGYREAGGCYRHPAGRRVIFLGDYIDRGPHVRRALAVVRAMADGGSAVALMGNHEFNAIAYHTPDPARPGEFLRKHTPANRHQHAATLDQLGGDVSGWVEWFKTLRPWLDLPASGPAAGLRAVHACWDPPSMGVVERAFERFGRFTAEFMAAASDPASDVYRTIEVVLKGPEVRLPDPHTFTDAEGTVRRQIRIRWYEPSAGRTFRTYGFPPDPAHPDVPVPAAWPGHPPDGPPVFFGHYWLRGEHPALLAPNVACLDWSVAKGGLLAAYRWDGERVLDPEKLVAVRCECGPGTGEAE